LKPITECKSLEEVRANIDRLDRQIVRLLAERGGYVKQAVRFKKTAEEVKAPERAGQVIANATKLARELGADISVTEAVYRAMVSAFINSELNEHNTLNK
jgi:isochorismate pyruvate lyase